MAKETALRRMVYVGIGLVITEAAFAAFVAIPRMALHPEIVKLGTVHAHWIFVIVKLIVGDHVPLSHHPEHSLQFILGNHYLGIYLGCHFDFTVSQVPQDNSRPLYLYRAIRDFEGFFPRLVTSNDIRRLIHLLINLRE